MEKTDLASFNNDWYNPGAGVLKRFVWHICSWFWLESGILIPYGFKRSLLRLFGASIARGVIIKPHVQIKYPWNLSIGAHSWIGEHVWIDNLDQVSIGSNVCISQGALILSGNHDYSKSSFDLMVKPIMIEDGAWVGAKSTITQGVNMGSHAVLSVGSVASQDMDPYGIYRGNPAAKVKDRTVNK